MINIYYKLHRDQMTCLIRDQIADLQDMLGLLENDDTIKLQVHRASFLRMQKVQGSLRFLRNKLIRNKLNKGLYESKAA